MSKFRKQFLGTLCGAVVAAAATQAAVAAPPDRAGVADGFSYAVAGDLLGPWRSRAGEQDPELEQVLRIFQSADGGFANLEGNLFDPDAFQGAPAAENGGFEQGGIGSGPRFDVEQAAVFRQWGINTIGLANNHSLDWGIEGLLDTMRNLDQAGVTHSGGGRSLAEARAAGFLETPRGRVALISAASTFLPMAPAGPGDAATKRAPRPGISALRYTAYTRVNDDEFQALRGIAARLGYETADDATDVTIVPNDAPFTWQHFRRSDAFGMEYEPHPQDRQEILDAISAGKRDADVAVFNIHAHESDTGAGDHLVPGHELQPPEFLQALMRDAVDAGADIGVVHGPHSLRGVEIYKGRPIFYGMGSLFFEVGALYDWPEDWFDTFAATTHFGAGGVREIHLHPLRIRREADTAAGIRVGAPRLADSAEARRILAALQDASRPFGTTIEIRGDIGVISIAPGSASGGAQ